MILLAAYYLAGIACLMWLDSTNHLNLAGMVNLVWAAFMRRRRYVGRHWADVLSTMQLVDEKRAARAALTEPTQSLFLPEFDDPAPVSPPYPHSLGVGRYAHLRPEELDWQAEHKKRAAALRVDLAALRVPVPTDDEWAAI